MNWIKKLISIILCVRYNHQIILGCFAITIFFTFPLTHAHAGGIKEFFLGKEQNLQALLQSELDINLTKEQLRSIPSIPEETRKEIENTLKLLYAGKEWNARSFEKAAKIYNDLANDLSVLEAIGKTIISVTIKNSGEIFMTSDIVIASPIMLDIYNGGKDRREIIDFYIARRSEDKNEDTAWRETINYVVNFKLSVNRNLLLKESNWSEYEEWVKNDFKPVQPDFISKIDPEKEKALRVAAEFIWDGISLQNNSQFKESLKQQVLSEIEKAQTAKVEQPSFLSHIWGAITTAVAKAAEAVKTFVTNGVQTTNNSLKTAYTSVKNFFTSPEETDIKPSDLSGQISNTIPANTDKNEIAAPPQQINPSDQQDQLRQAEEAKKKQAKEEEKRLEAELQKQEDQKKIEEQRNAQAAAEEDLKKAKTAEEKRIAEEARKKAEQARIVAEQEAQKHQQEEALRRVREEQRQAEEQRKAQAAAEEAKRKEQQANLISCNGRNWSKCPEGQTFYCPPAGNPQCRVVTEKPNINISQLENQIHALINNERQKQSLSALDWDGRLADIARSHSQDMAVKNYFNHTGPDGCDTSCRYKQVNYIFSTLAENIGRLSIYKSTYSNGTVAEYNTQAEIAASAVQGWMNSSCHRKNILTPNFSNEGIGVAMGNDGAVFVTENFSFLSDALPLPSPNTEMNNTACEKTFISFPKDGETYSLDDPNFSLSYMGRGDMGSSKYWERGDDKGVNFTMKNTQDRYSLVYLEPMGWAFGVSGVSGISGKCNHWDVGQNLSRAGKIYFILYKGDFDLWGEWEKYVKGKGAPPTDDYYISTFTTTGGKHTITATIIDQSGNPVSYDSCTINDCVDRAGNLVQGRRPMSVTTSIKDKSGRMTGLWHTDVNGGMKTQSILNGNATLYIYRTFLDEPIHDTLIKTIDFKVQGSDVDLGTIKIDL